MERNLILKERGIESLLEELSKRLGVKVIDHLGSIPLGGNYRPDGYVLLELSGEKLPLIVEVRGHLSSLYPLKKFLNFAKDFQGACCLVAEAIEIGVKEQLKSHGIGYYEINNELFFPVTYKVFGDKTTIKEIGLTSSKGFHAESGLKLLFYFVVSPESLKFTQRQLSEKLGISLASVNLAIKNLEKLGAIRLDSKGDKKLGDLEELIDRWRFSYGDIEKKKLYVGRFSPINDDAYSDWEKLPLNKVKGYWGGEPGASILTNNYLSPGLFTIYTYENSLGEILKNLRLKKDPMGKIEIVKAFWPEEINDQEKRIVPQFLIYCELLNSGIDRNKETATILKKDLIRKEEKK